MRNTAEDEPYRGVRALFNGDFQAVLGFVDRTEWVIESRLVINYIGAAAIEGADVSINEKE